MSFRTATRILRAVLCTTALAIAGPAITAGPVHAAASTADQVEHCVLIVPNAEHVRCFPTVAEAEQFAAEHGAGVAGPSKEAGAAAAPSGARAAFVVLTKLSVEYELPLFLGSSLTVYGTNGPCTTTTADIDYSLATMPVPPATSLNWVNRISSFITYNNCWTKHFSLPNWSAAGNVVGWQGTQPVIAGLLDNDTSSMRWS